LKYLKIKSHFGSYEIKIFPNEADIASLSHRTDVWLLDKNISNQMSIDRDKSILINAVEENKTLESCGGILAKFKELDLKRGGVITVAGGGVLQDLGTLSASIYMRGVKWHFLPTTLLAMVDSCIGGKSSINHGNYKNIIGNYYPPNSIYIFPTFCRTLDQGRIIEGVFEAIKICFAKGHTDYESIWKYLNLNSGLLTCDFHELIFTSLSAKKYFIEIDEFDDGPRLLLNFGHTFGHALEAASDYEVPHGVAVGIGMLMACRFSTSSGFVKKQNKHSEKLCDDIHRLLGYWGPLPALLENIDANLAMKAFLSDKKHGHGYFRLILPNCEGTLEIVKIEKNIKNTASIFSLFEKCGGLR